MEKDDVWSAGAVGVVPISICVHLVNCSLVARCPGKCEPVAKADTHLFQPNLARSDHTSLVNHGIMQLMQVRTRAEQGR